MNPELLITTFPYVYHMADYGAWPSIKKHGLLSTSALLDLFEEAPERRLAIESRRRNTSVVINHQEHGEAVIRDNKPMDDGGLLRALTDMSPTQWYQSLNSKVFFWLTEQRLQTLLTARAYRDRRHCVLTVDTRRLVRDYEERIWLCPINSGATKPMAVKRGSDTFRRIRDYPFDDRLKVTRSATKAVAELAIDYSVANLVDYVGEVTIRDQSGVIEEIFRRDAA